MDFLRQNKYRKIIVGGVAGILALVAVIFAIGRFSAPAEKTDWWQESSTTSAAKSMPATTNSTTASSAQPTEIYVDLKGAVTVPGVYKVAAGSRLFEVIQLAGGLLSTADLLRVNQASIVSDQLAVYVPQVGEEVSAELLAASETAQSSPGKNLTTDSKVNINTADATQLQTLPGIGNVKAQAILKYRTENGSFSVLEGLLKVAGIGEATFTNLQDLITIG